MKLIVQIPAYNEEDSILEVLKNIPKKIDGVDEIQIFLLDDGSNDKTSKIAYNYKVDKIIQSPYRIGLAKTFKKGLDIARFNNADILVNIDGDNQYCARCIEKLIQPIINKQADMVIGARPIDSIEEFSLAKKRLQKIGTKIVNLFSNTLVDDATSGFRAFSKYAIEKIEIRNNFTYTIETIVQANFKKIIIQNVEIDVNPQKNRISKLFKTNIEYVLKQTFVLFFSLYNYYPKRFFCFVGFFVLLIIFMIILF